MTENETTPRLSQEEAQDFIDKVKGFASTLSPTQRSFLRHAINSQAEAARNEGGDVQGYDYAGYPSYDTGYYDVNTGNEIYVAPWYNNSGQFEGYYYTEY